MDDKFKNYFLKKHNIELTQIEKLEEKKLNILKSLFTKPKQLFNEYYFTHENQLLGIKELERKLVEKIGIKIPLYGNKFYYLEHGGFVLSEDYVFLTSDTRIRYLNYDQILNGIWRKSNHLFSKSCHFQYENFDPIEIKCDIFDLVKLFFKEYESNFKKWKDFINKNIKLIDLQLKLLKEENVGKLKKNYLMDIPTDEFGKIILIEYSDFEKLLHINQSYIISKNDSLIQKFVKISLYLKSKKSNIHKIFNSLKTVTDENTLTRLMKLLKNQIHTYETLVFHSLSMITSLVENDLITFYEIYECFDQIGVFNSNWENEVSNKLTNIGTGINDLMVSIYNMENRIVDSVNNLSYVTRDSFKELNKLMEKQLGDINTTLNINNLLTGIQTYQMYKINQNIKRIN